MKILVWHVHGSWMTAFVHGRHDYFVPLVPGRGPDGRGRAQTWEWPQSVQEVSYDDLPSLDFDCVIVQSVRELNELAPRALGRRRLGDIPTIFLEHNAPQGAIEEMRHPAADRPDLTLVHVTYFNDVFWDAGTTPTRVIEHGIVDPGYRFPGQTDGGAAATTGAKRRGRVTGTDLLSHFEKSGPIDLFGMGAAALGGYENLTQTSLHDAIPRRRLYLHPVRWTSLGLSLIEAMHLGMPIVALATTEVPIAVPPEAGVISTKLEVLDEAIRELLGNGGRARAMGLVAREHARARYGLERFLNDWDALMEEVIS